MRDVKDALDVSGVPCPKIEGPEFKPGDRVRCIDPEAGLALNAVYEVDGLYGVVNNRRLVYLVGIPDTRPYFTGRFELVSRGVDPNHPGASGCYHCKDGTEPCICPRGIGTGFTAYKQHPPEDAFVPPNAANEFTEVGMMAVGSVPKPDAVNLPQHYARFAIEPIRFLVENYGPCILVGKVVKYSMRYDAKNGLEDLKKARRCLDMLIKHTMGDPDWWKREAP